MVSLTLEQVQGRPKRLPPEVCCRGWWKPTGWKSTAAAADEAEKTVVFWRWRVVAVGCLVACRSDLIASVGGSCAPHSAPLQCEGSAIRDAWTHRHDCIDRFELRPAFAISRRCKTEETPSLRLMGVASRASGSERIASSANAQLRLALLAGRSRQCFVRCAFVGGISRDGFVQIRPSHYAR